MNKSLLSSLDAILETKNISKAAELMSVSQPALSAQLKRAEEQYNIEIFDRTVQPLEITEQGRIFIEYLKKKKQLDEKLVNELVKITILEKGNLTVGGATAFNHTYLPEAVKLYNQLYPNIKISILDDNVPNLVMKTLNNEADLFISSPTKRVEGICFERLLNTKIYLCVPMEYAQREKYKEYIIPFEEIDSGEKHKEISLKEFEDIPYILLNESKHLGRLMRKLMDVEGIVKEHYIEMDQAITSYIFSSKGVGISLMSGMEIKNISVGSRPGFFMINNRYCSRDMYIGYKKNRKMSKAATEFIKVLKDNFLSSK